MPSLESKLVLLDEVPDDVDRGLRQSDPSMLAQLISISESLSEVPDIEELISMEGREESEEFPVCTV